MNENQSEGEEREQQVWRPRGKREDNMSMGLKRRFGFVFVFLSFFLGPHLKHMEVPRLGVKLELQLPAYTTATTTEDLSRVCQPHHSSRQHQILNPLSEARDQTRNLMNTS